MLDKESPVPVYIQIQEELKRWIEEEKYSVGTAIPPEWELTELFGVSRMTVRHAVTKLVNDGLLQREKGRGTFVAAPKLKVEQPLTGLTGFTEDMQARGLTPSSRLVGFGSVFPELEIAQELHIKTDEKVFQVERVRYADGIPMAIERSYLPVKLLPGLTEDQLQHSLYSLIEQESGLSIDRAVQRMEAALAKKEDAKLLQIESAAAVLKIERVSFLSDDKPFEVVRSIYRADRYTFTVGMHRT
ncbi:GntR family transcriptional regulator [Planococcus lenghuensis]|uniref:Phosphonate metabolism transcriptional regulator PhnF n=1 Tax=Planococcus lenghuensis TaxID=2213202 RepID=A0A1Q2L4Z0_9BACL|nr:GntR family transcriptional regulator [Planococcus lenghuensis]AQQ55499.1 phosphonate metabolism transcriptional regulator PhnF [Planococcus lenghuensis]